MTKWYRSSALVLLIAGSAGAQESAVGIAGNEAFPGISMGQYTIGATFAGWTSAAGSGRSDWYPITENGGRSWSTSLIYAGSARIPGESVEIIDGFWLLNEERESSGGRAVGGEVQWPPEAASSDWPCWASARYATETYPVAKVDAVLLAPGDAGGTLTGCLDDIHWDPDEPLQNIPHVWGVIRIGAPPVAPG